jgi:hypothetical protein
MDDPFSQPWLPSKSALDENEILKALGASVIAN